MSTGRETLHTLHGRKKLEYLWAYYKLPIFAVLVVLYIVGYLCYRQATKKETVLYTALVNVSAGQELTEQLSTDFLEYLDLSTRKNEVVLLNGLPLTESDEVDREYTYASEMKLLASMDAEQLDVVLFDAEARDAFVRNEYLCDLASLVREADLTLYEQLAPYFIQDGTCLDVSFASCIQQAGLSGEVYLGVVANTPRTGAVIQYLRYLAS